MEDISSINSIKGAKTAKLQDTKSLFFYSYIFPRTCGHFLDLLLQFQASTFFDEKSSFHYDPTRDHQPTRSSSLHQATDCHCSTVKVCKDGNEWMALLRSPSWWKQWNQQNICRKLWEKIHTYPRGVVKQQSKTCVVSSSLTSRNYFRDRSLCMQFLPCGSSRRFAKYSTSDNIGSSKIYQQ